MHLSTVSNFILHKVYDLYSQKPRGDKNVWHPCFLQSLQKTLILDPQIQPNVLTSELPKTWKSVHRCPLLRKVFKKGSFCEIARFDALAVSFVWIHHINFYIVNCLLQVKKYCKVTGNTILFTWNIIIHEYSFLHRTSMAICKE